MNPNKKIKDFVDDEIDISYNAKFESPQKQIDDSDQEDMSIPRTAEKIKNSKENESIVPPLALKNIGSSKNTQNTTTGKLTRTTMHTTQIRDKVPLNNLKSNIIGNNPLTNHKSNVDSNEINEGVMTPNEGMFTHKIEENQFESRTSRSSSSSGYGYPLDDDVHVEIPKQGPSPLIVPKLNFAGKIPLKGGPMMNQGPKVPPLNIPAKPEVQPKAPKIGAMNLGLKLENIKKKDFQDEFMERFDEYSKSWRDQIEQQKRF